MTLPGSEELLAIAPCGFLSFTDDARIVYVNDTLRNLLAYGPDDLVGRHIDILLTVPSRIFFQTHLFPLIRLHRHADEIYFTLKPKHGENVAVLANALRARHGDAFLNHCVLMRVHHRKQYEEALLEAKRVAESALQENRQLFEQAQAARADAEAANRANRLFWPI